MELRPQRALSSPTVAVRSSGSVPLPSGTPLPRGSDARIGAGRGVWLQVHCFRMILFRCSDALQDLITVQWK